MGFESGYALSGGLAEYCMLAPGTSPIKVPDKMPLELITPASCATATVMAAMHGVYGSRPLSEEEAAVALQLSPNQFRAHHAAALSVIERHFRALSTEAA
jgi:hypothetical protein